jgi:hypothetical protein
MTQQPDPNGLSLLLHELREDPGEHDELERAALSRVRQRLAVSLTAHGMLDATAEDSAHVPRASVAVRRQSKWRWAASSGALAALAVGTALGASGHALVSFIIERPASAPSAHVTKRTAHLPKPVFPTKTSPAVLLPVPAPNPGLVAPSAAPPREKLPRSATAAPAIEAGFDPELRELEAARRALVGNPSQALDALRLHGQRYPRSVLSQEREALTVKALVAAGRHAEARAAATTFSQRHPESMLLDSVQNAIRSIP